MVGPLKVIVLQTLRTHNLNFQKIQLLGCGINPSIYGITLNRYAQTDMIGKPNNVKMFGSKKPMGLNRVAKIG